MGLGHSSIILLLLIDRDRLFLVFSPRDDASRIGVSGSTCQGDAHGHLSTLMGTFLKWSHEENLSCSGCLFASLHILVGHSLSFFLIIIKTTPFYR